jgi:photosystem II stability/assembly factor-like uncharacterized protein
LVYSKPKACGGIGERYNKSNKCQKVKFENVTRYFFGIPYLETDFAQNDVAMTIMIRLITGCVLLFFSFSSMAQWAPLSTTFDGPLEDVFFFDVDTGLIAGSSGIWKTTDGGASWTATTASAATYFTAVHFCDGCAVGYAVGYDTSTDQGVVFRSDDQGTSWQLQQPVGDPPPRWNDVFVAADRILIVGDHGRMIRSLDDGTTWDEPITFPDARINSVHYRPGSYRTIYGTSTGVYRGTDAWASIAAGTININDGFFDGGRGYAVGNGQIYRTTTNNQLNYLLDYATNPDVHFHCIADGGNNGKMIGSTNGIYRLSAFSNNIWGVQPSTFGYEVFAITYAAPDTAFAVTAQGVVLKITNGGELIVPVTYFTNPPGNCVGNSIEFSNFNYYSYYDYTWKVNGEVVSNTPSLNHAFPELGTYTVELIASNDTGNNTFSAEVLIVNPPDTTFALGGR